MTKRKVTDEIIAVGRKMRADDRSYAAIARATGISRGTAYRMLNPVADARYRVKNTERARTCVKDDAFKQRHCAASAKYYKARSDDEAFMEKARVRAHKWYNNNKKRAIIAALKCRKRNPSGHNANNAARRALLLGATAGNLAEIAEIYRAAKERKRVRCYLCGNLIPMGERHVDHIVPLSRGGAHRPSNLAVACTRCNTSKQAKLPGELGVLI